MEDLLNTSWLPKFNSFFEELIQPSQVVFSEPLAAGVHANRINGTNPKDSIAITGEEQSDRSF